MDPYNEYNNGSSKLTQQYDNSPTPYPYSTSLNETSPKRDMFDKSEQLIQVQKTVNGCVRVLGVLQKAVELQIHQTGDQDTALNQCKGLVTKGFHSIKNQIENFERINTNGSPTIIHNSPSFSPSNSGSNSSNNSSNNSPSNSINNSPSKSPIIIQGESITMPDGSSCKKIEAKSILIQQVQRFEKLLEDLAGLESVAKNPSSEKCKNFQEMQTDLKEMTLKVRIANEDFEDIETQILNILARLGPSKRHHSVKGTAKTDLYKEFLNHYSKIALIKDQFETYLLILAARVELLRPGKDLSEKMQEEMNSLNNFNSNTENIEVKGILSYSYVKVDKENSFKSRVKEVTDNLTCYTKEAMTYKERLQEFLTKKVIFLNEHYFRDLAYGEKEQLDINAKSYTEANSKAINLRSELLKDINQIWATITDGQKDLYINLQIAVHAIEAKTSDSAEMYFISKTRMSWKVDSKALLNPDVNVKEEEFAWMKDSK